MSDRYLKTTYIEEGEYGIEKEKIIYMRQTSDYVTIYDESFDIIFSFQDTTYRPLHLALIELWNDDPEDNNKLKYLTEEEIKKIKL